MSKNAKLCNPYLSDTLNPKTPLSARWAQMSQQAQIIEKKKQEIQAKVDAQKRACLIAQAQKANANVTEADVAANGLSNIFSNDGSFLDHFKKMTENMNKVAPPKQAIAIETANAYMKKDDTKRDLTDPKSIKEEVASDNKEDTKSDEIQKNEPVVKVKEVKVEKEENKSSDEQTFDQYKGFGEKPNRSRSHTQERNYDQNRSYDHNRNNDRDRSFGRDRHFNQERNYDRGRNSDRERQNDNYRNNDRGRYDQRDRNYYRDRNERQRPRDSRYNWDAPNDNYSGSRSPVIPGVEDRRQPPQYPHYPPNQPSMNNNCPPFPPFNNPPNMNMPMNPNNMPQNFNRPMMPMYNNPPRPPMAPNMMPMQNQSFMNNGPPMPPNMMGVMNNMGPPPNMINPNMSPMGNMNMPPINQQNNFPFPNCPPPPPMLRPAFMPHQNNCPMPMGPVPIPPGNFIQSNNEQQPKLPENTTLKIIPEPKPLEAVAIPPPEPMNLQLIPPPMPICLNQIPKPKEIDPCSIPAPPSYVLSTDGAESDGPPATDRLSEFPARLRSLNPSRDHLTQDNSTWYGDDNHSSDYNEYDGYYDESSNKVDNVRPEDKYEPELCLEDDSEEEDYARIKNQENNEIYDRNEHQESNERYARNDDQESNENYEGNENFEKNDVRERNDRYERNDKYDDFYERNNSEEKLKLESNSVGDDSRTKSERDDDSDAEKSDKRNENRRKKRKSRWGDGDLEDTFNLGLLPLPPAPPMPPLNPPALPKFLPGTLNLNLLPTANPSMMIPLPLGKGEESLMLTKITRRDPALLQYANMNYGSTNLSEEDWSKCEGNFKLNLLYQDMVAKRQKVEQLAEAGRNKYEYDSDEDIQDGTWEHKLRTKEMDATKKWAAELTKQAAGKHHIGDFLPPEELKKFMEKYTSVKGGKEPDLSDYKEFKLKEDNLGFQMLQKLGWNEGQGLGAEGTGITQPVNNAVVRDSNQGLGVTRADNPEANDDEFDAYRKRMMLAYRFRPNPLNNPRRPYY